MLLDIAQGAQSTCVRSALKEGAPRARRKISSFKVARTTVWSSVEVVGLFLVFFQGRARTQSPTIRNYAPE